MFQHHLPCLLLHPGYCALGCWDITGEISYFRIYIYPLGLCTRYFIIIIICSVLYNVLFLAGFFACLQILMKVIKYVVRYISRFWKTEWLLYIQLCNRYLPVVILICLHQIWNDFYSCWMLPTKIIWGSLLQEGSFHLLRIILFRNLVKVEDSSMRVKDFSWNDLI